jgi:hypothetical protein
MCREKFRTKNAIELQGGDGDGLAGKQSLMTRRFYSGMTESQLPEKHRTRRTAYNQKRNLRHGASLDKVLSLRPE